jgi:RNA polymerase sigma-70 factor (ECF subfamily)
MLSFYLSLIETEEDKAQFEKIYCKYLDWMVQIAYHYTKNIHDAEDIVNDVFMDIIKTNSSIPTNNDDETKSYLFICLRNRIKKAMKDNKGITIIEFDKLANFFSTEDTESKALQGERYDELKSFIDTMNPIYKDVLTLYFFFGKSLREISKEFDLPLNTVSTRFKRGKAILKERFTDLEI